MNWIVETPANSSLPAFWRFRDTIEKQLSEPQCGVLQSEIAARVIIAATLPCVSRQWVSRIGVSVANSAIAARRERTDRSMADDRNVEDGSGIVHWSPPSDRREN